MLTRRELAGVILAALLLVLPAGLVTRLAGPGHPAAPARTGVIFFTPSPSPVPACKTEDSPGPCTWDARTRGNHQGRSFTATPSPERQPPWNEASQA